MSDSGQVFLPLEKRLPFLEGDAWWRRVLRRALEQLMGLPEVRRRAELARRLITEDKNGFEALVEVMGFEVDAPGLMEAIPREGPLVVMANHPLGGPEALVVSMLTIRARPDTRVLGNAEATALPGLDRWILPLEILGGEGATRRNLGVLKQGLSHVDNGGTLVVFPSGAVSHWQWETARVEDPPWPLHTARLIARSGAAVLPVRVFGQNGPWFQLLGALHPLLRSALLMRAFLARAGRPIRCRPGQLRRACELPDDPVQATRVLRQAVDAVPEGEGK